MTPTLIHVGLYLGFLGAGWLIRHLSQPAAPASPPVAPPGPPAPATPAPSHPLLAAAWKAIQDYEQQHQAQLAQQLLAILQQASVPTPAK